MSKEEQDYDPKAVNRWMDRNQGAKSLGGRLYKIHEEQDNKNAPPKVANRRIDLPGKDNDEKWPVESDQQNHARKEEDCSEQTGATGALDTQPDPEKKEASIRERRSSSGKYGDISYLIHDSGINALLEIKLNQGAHFKAESGAMVTMSDTIKLKGRIDGGIGKALVRKAFSKEKFFFQYFTSPDGPGTVIVAPTSIGDIGVIEMSRDEKYTVQKDGFLAATSGLDIGTKMQSLSKGLFSGEGFFVLKVEGAGLLFINSFGNIHRVDIPAERSITVDNKHLVAWPSRMKWEIVTSSGLFSTFTSGEILVCKFRGPGHIYIQSRNPEAFSAWVAKEGELVTKKQMSAKR